MNSDLNAAIEGLYAAFRRPRAPARVEGCPCCTTEAELEPLSRVPLRELSSAQIDQYAFKALTTVGTVEDFRYFLPRLVELALGDQLETDRPVLFGKPAYGQWRTWPAAEQLALERFAAALTGTFSAQVYEEYDLDAWVCALGQFLEDLPPYLAPLIAPTAPAAENLVRLYELNCGDLKRGTLWSAYWRDRPNAAQFIDWFGRVDVQEAIDMAYVRRHGFETPDPRAGDQESRNF